MGGHIRIKDLFEGFVPLTEDSFRHLGAGGSGVADW